MRAVAEHAKTAGVMLAVEYLNRFETYFLTCAADTVKFIKEVNHPSCRMMYDTFHANIEEKGIADAIRTAAPYTVHVHISENDRSTPGQGHVAWKETFDTLNEVGYDGWMVVEAFGLALPEIGAATKIWRRMYQSEEQLAGDALKFMKAETSTARLSCRRSHHKPLHAVVHRIEHVDAAAAVEDEGPRVVQLARLAADAAPAVDRFAVEREFLHAVIAELADVDVALAVERQAVRIIQLSRFAAGFAPELD